MEWKDFILAHEGDDLSRLVLSRDKYPDVDIPLAVSTIGCRRSLRYKVPEWYMHPDLVLPLRLSAEQCSSTATARYKASLALSCITEECASREDSIPLRSIPAPPTASCVICDANNLYSAGPSTWRGRPASRKAHSSEIRIADLTGGLGVDSWAFSEVASEVLYNEALPELCEAAAKNFSILGAENVRIVCHRVGETPVREILGDFRPDILYLDPARRGEGGRKVFLLEDCSPDVKALLPELFSAVRFILLKLSPMADISMLLERLPHTREVHIVEAKGECKELLLLLDRSFEGEAEIVAVELRDHDGNHVFRFRRSEAADAHAGWAVPEAGMLLFEPGKALSKAGCFKLFSQRSGLAMTGHDSHLYLSDNQIVPCDERASLGKWFRILEVLPLDKRGIAQAGRDYPGADVSARGVQMSSDELARRLRKAGGKRTGAGGVHLFGVHSDLSGCNLLLVTAPVL